MKRGALLLQTKKSIRHGFFICMFILITSLQGAGAAPPAFGVQAPPSFADLADEVKHAVVNISTTQVVKGRPLQPFIGPNSPFRDFFGDDFLRRFFGDVPQGELKTHALGSGVVIDEDGLILTNNHVVEKATAIRVKLHSGKEYDAKIVGRDPKTDLALIQTKPDDDFPKPVHLGDSDATRVGDWVAAVGNPFGLGHTVTVGIISAKGRVIGAGPYDDFLQTDAAINPGNSGGPLFNMKGEAVGINTAIIAQGQGIGFAIPINLAKDLLPQLKSGKIIRGWLGVMIQEITPELAKAFGLKNMEGVLISDIVDDSPAQQAGLKRGDVVLRFDGKEVESARTLSRVVASMSPGTQVMVDILRNGSRKSLKMTIGTMAGQMEEAEPQKEKVAWGLTVEDLSPQLAERLGLDTDEGGVVVANVAVGSPAANAGLQPGDLIKEVNHEGIHNLKDYIRAVKKAKRDEDLLILIKRAGVTVYMVLQPSSKE